MSRVPELPTEDRFAWPQPSWSTPPNPTMPDRKEGSETVLVGPDGRTPLMQRKPIPFGFRPERASR